MLLNANPGLLSGLTGFLVKLVDRLCDFVSIVLWQALKIYFLDLDKDQFFVKENKFFKSLDIDFYNKIQNRKTSKQETRKLDTRPGTVPGRQFDWGGRLPNGNGGAHKGWLSRDGNAGDRTKPQASFTARQIGRAVAKAGFSEPTVACRCAEDHQIKVTPGITG